MMKKNIPELRFPEFEGEYKQKTLGDLTSNFSNRNKDLIDAKVYSVTNVNGFVLQTEHFEDRVIAGNDLTNYKIIRNGDFAYNPARINVGSIAQFKESVGIISSLYVCFNVKGDLFDKYLYYFLQLDLTKKKISDFGEGGVRIYLWYELFALIPIKIPTIKEQQKIAEFLIAVDDKINQLKEKKRLLEQYKKGMMQKIFSQEIRFKDENGKEFPKWEKKRLAEVAKIKTGNSNREDSSLNGEYTFFDRSQDIRTSSIYLFDGEAIIVAGEGQDFVPKYFIGKFDLHQRTYSIMEFKKVNGKYLYYYIYKNRSYFLSQAVGSTVKSLRLPMFEKMDILIPHSKEQTIIADFLSAINDKIELISKKIEKTELWKKGLLQKMFC